MSSMKKRKGIFLYLLMGLMALAIGLILLYIIPGRYSLYQTSLYDPVEDVPANPMMGFAPKAEDKKACANTKLVLIDLDLETWEPEPGTYDREGLKKKYHIEYYKKRQMHAVLRFRCRKAADGLKRDIPASIEALADYLAGDSFVSYVEVDAAGRRYVRNLKEAFPEAYVVAPSDYTKTEENGTGLYYRYLGDPEKQEEALRSVSMEDFWKQAPAAGFLAKNKSIGELFDEDLSELLQEIRDAHITYISNQCPDQEGQTTNGARMICQTLGYCIYISRLQTTVNFRKDTVREQFTFKNTGAAPCYANWPVIMRVYDYEDKEIYAGELPVSLKDLEAGRETEVVGEFPYNKNLKKGYSISIQIANPENEKDYITLAQKETEAEENGEHTVYIYDPEHQGQNVQIAQPDSYSGAMISLLSALSDYAKSKNPDFLMLTNGGYELYMPEHNSSEENLLRLTSSMDGMIIESLFYGWDGVDNKKTPAKVSKEMKEAVRDAKEAGLAAFNIEYCSKKKLRTDSANKSRKAGTVWFNATDMELNNIPDLAQNRVNEESVKDLSDVKNFLTILNPDNFKTKKAYLAALSDTDYDLLFVDLYFRGSILKKKDVESLQKKKNGRRRLVCAYMSVGEAEDYRDYWQESWDKNPPPWICEVNEEWDGNFKVMYWTKSWRDILFGSENSYLDQIINAGFDGVYMDVVDAYEYFEEK